ncbi:hypothetical protein MJO28_004395 [Puccinia striiformis f. sp. tritici]|uniref:Uncharacterized protein n=1 Tax=Puccinia striiformis f. sp. tritici TaxID=168172 RepID=A0ACC0EPA9_9BASI|nr:hypothetical protein MJO28_004395 [Puccinia striiformis f. sp. tritici]
MTQPSNLTSFKITSSTWPGFATQLQPCTITSIDAHNLCRKWQSLSTQPNRPSNGQNTRARLLRSHLSVSSILARPALTGEFFGDNLRVPVMPVFLSRLMCSITQPGPVGCWTLKVWVSQQMELSAIHLLAPHAVHVMSAYPGQKSVFVMDNTRIHHGRRVREICEANQLGPFICHLTCQVLIQSKRFTSRGPESSPAPGGMSSRSRVFSLVLLIHS